MIGDQKPTHRIYSLDYHLVISAFMYTKTSLSALSQLTFVDMKDKIREKLEDTKLFVSKPQDDQLKSFVSNSYSFICQWSNTN